MRKKVHFEGLNALRFFAAFAVLIFHSSQWYHHNFNTPLKMFLHNLPVAVDFFFVLSGFLIIYLLIVEKKETGNISLKNFYIRRFLRIFPLYYLIILIAYLFLQDGSVVAWHKFMYFGGNFWMISKNAWTLSALNPLWSISIEEHFYLVIPFLIMISPIKYLKYILASIVLLSFGFRIYATLAVPDNWMTIYMHTFSQMDLLAIGGLLAIYHINKPLKFNIGAGFYALFLFAFIILLTLVDTKDYHTVYLASIKKYLFTIPLLFLFIGFVFNENSLLNKLKHQKWLNYFGKISYGIYLYNAFIIDLLDRVNWLHQHYAVKLFFDISLTLIAATLSYELFEKQFLKLKRKFQVIKT